jgi:lysophospholipase L1-like esterase
MPNAPDVLVMGDSIAAAFPRPLLEETFPGLRIGKIAASGERVQETRWKLDQVGHLQPKKVVLIVGTNNLGRNPPCAIAAGIVDLADAIQRKLQPRSLRLLAILPRGPGGGYRRADRLEINAAVAAALAGRGVRIIDMDDQLSCAPCGPFKDDNTHLTPEGYRLLADMLMRR